MINVRHTAGFLRVAMAGRLRVSVQQAEAQTLVFIEGVVDEESDFSGLARLTGDLVINLKGVRRFNSAGIHDWVEVLRELSQHARFVFTECSPTVMLQLNMLHGFLDQAPVLSFYAPMRCEACDLEVDQLFQTVDCSGGLPVTLCPRCRRPLTLDEVEDRYLLFLHDGSAGRRAP